MDLKSLFRGKPKGKRRRPAADDDDGQPTIEDLIVSEQFEEAEIRLKHRLKETPEDLHAHLKLADVYIQLQRGADAVQEYVFVAEEYARDGFYDKAIALLGKATRLVPLDERLRLKTEGLKAAKQIEQKRTAAVEGLREGGAAGNAWAMEVQRNWHHLARGPLIQALPDDQVRRLFGAMVLTRWDRGSVVAQPQIPGDELYLVLHGALEARIESDDGTHTSLRTFASGDILGESVLFERRPWPATVVATESTALLTLSRLGLEQTLVGNPDPRGLLDALRRQGQDLAVSNMVRKLRTGAASG